MPAREHGRAVLLRPPQCLHGQVSRAEWPDCGRRRTKRRSKTPEKCRATPQMKDPSGGTTGRVKPYGRLGWMGARAEYSRWEGIPAPTCHWSPGARRTFKTAGRFFNFLGTSFRDENLSRGRTIGLDDGRFIRRH